MRDLMIDLETLGTRVNCPVLTIGACFFNIETGEIGEKFDGAIAVESAMKFGTADGGTIKWWMSQSDDARQKAFRGTHDAPTVFKAFYDFCLTHGSDFRPWGNGSSFDISILDVAFPRVLDRRAPWNYSNVMDCRTIKRVAEDLYPFKGEREGTHHSALDDAIFQARWVSFYWQSIRGTAPVVITPTGFSL